MIQNGIVNIYFMIQYSTPPYAIHISCNTSSFKYLNICKVSPVCAERHFPPFHQCKWSSSIAIHSARNSPFKYYKSNSGIAAANGLIKIWNLPIQRRTKSKEPLKIKASRTVGCKIWPSAHLTTGRGANVGFFWALSIPLGLLAK